MQEKKHFISIMKPTGNKCVQYDELISRHCDYLKEKFDSGVVILAGPSDEEGENHFALVVLETKDKDQAIEIMNADPAVFGNALSSQISEFDVFLSRGA